MLTMAVRMSNPSFILVIGTGVIAHKLSRRLQRQSLRNNKHKAEGHGAPIFVGL